MNNDEITQRAESVTEYYDALIEAVNVYNNFGVGTHTINGETVEVNLRNLKKKLYLTVASVNILEAIRFYVSFACSFAFAERAKMEGNAKVIKLIARDEALHLTGTQHMMQLFAQGKDDPEMAIIAAECKQEVIDMFADAAQQEKDWADYLFKNGSMIGLNKEILSQYVEYITNQRLIAVGFDTIFPNAKSNPLPWMNAWLVSDNVQVAPQESEISSYLVGAIDSEVDTADFGDFSL
jgi:ribonucleoside-diphosphate reductase beta chain